MRNFGAVKYGFGWNNEQEITENSAYSVVLDGMKASTNRNAYTKWIKQWRGRRLCGVSLASACRQIGLAFVK